MKRRDTERRRKGRTKTRREVNVLEELAQKSSNSIIRVELLDIFLAGQGTIASSIC